MPGSQNLPKSDQNAIFDFRKKNTLGVLGMVENSNWLAQKIVDKILKHFSESPRPPKIPAQAKLGLKTHLSRDLVIELSLA